MFVGLKLHDVTGTVGISVQNLSDNGISFLGVYRHEVMLEAVVENCIPHLKVLLFTFLSCLDQKDAKNRLMKGVLAR